MTTGKVRCTCANPACGKEFLRPLMLALRESKTYCSRACNRAVLSKVWVPRRVSR